MRSRQDVPPEYIKVPTAEPTGMVANEGVGNVNDSRLQRDEGYRPRWWMLCLAVIYLALMLPAAMLALLTIPLSPWHPVEELYPPVFVSRLLLPVTLLVAALGLLCSSSKRMSEICAWLPAPPLAIVVMQLLSYTLPS